MKKYLQICGLSGCIILLLVTCKKDSQKKPVMNFDVTGTWTLAEFKSTYIDTIDATVSQYPCMAGNQTVYLSDGRTITRYSGQSACYISPRGSTGTSVGKVGGIPDTGQWKVKGNILINKTSSSSKLFYSVLSVVNGKLEATLIDTLNYSPFTYYDTIVDIKQ